MKLKNILFELNISNPDLERDIQEYADLSDKIDRMTAELNDLKKKFEVRDQQVRTLINKLQEEFGDSSETFIRAKNILITIKTKGYNRTDKSYKTAFDELRKKVNAKMQLMIDEVLKSTETVTYIKSKLAVQRENRIIESNIFQKIKNWFLSKIRKLHVLNSDTNAFLDKVESKL